MSVEPGLPQPRTVYESVGGEPTFRRIIARFYEQVAVDEVLRPLYPEEDLGPAEERLRLFFIQYWGGPATYTQMRGHPRLGMRHIPFRIARPHRDAWLRAMRIAIDEADLPQPQRDMIWGHMETVAWNLTTHAAPRE